MIKIIPRRNLVCVVLGAAVSGLVLLVLLLSAGRVLGYSPAELGWNRFLMLQAVMFAVQVCALFLIGFRFFRKRSQSNGGHASPEFAAQASPHSATETHDGMELAVAEMAVAVSPAAKVWKPVPDSGLGSFGSLHFADGGQRLDYIADHLKHSSSFWFSYIEHNGDAIYFMDLEGRVRRVNPAFEALYGFTEEEVARAGRTLFVPARLLDEFDGLVERVKAGCEVSGYETLRVTNSGREIHVSLTLSPVLQEGGEVVALVAVSRDITARKETENLLRRSEKLSVIGQLAAGVAHEIRNPLTTLRGFVQLQKQRQTGNQEHLELMLEEIERINFIISEFIILSKPHLNQFGFKDMTLMLTDLFRFLEPQFNLNNIRLEAKLEQSLPNIRCEENQLKQVFLNVIRNSMESMPDGGVVRVEAARVTSGKVMVRITDDGIGMPQELLIRLGEPFLTSKENGTGLGIMVSQQIVANHKGRMVIRSQIGKGTCVDIVLPMDFEEMSAEEADRERAWHT